MKKIMLLFLCLVLGGCCSKRYEEYVYGFFLPSGKITPHPELKASSKWFGIPLVCWQEKKGSPYDVKISFISTNQPSTSVTLKKVILTDPEGREHNLLESDVTLNSFNKRGFHAAHATHGSFRGYVYESKWTHKKLPIKFIKGKSCSIRIEYMIGEASLSDQWTLRNRLIKKTQSIIGWVKDS